MSLYSLLFFFNDTATTEIYTLSLHDALPIYSRQPGEVTSRSASAGSSSAAPGPRRTVAPRISSSSRSEEHTSELQSRQYLVCRLLLEKKKSKYIGVRLVRTTEYGDN